MHGTLTPRGYSSAIVLFFAFLCNADGKKRTFLARFAADSAFASTEAVFFRPFQNPRILVLLVAPAQILFLPL